MKIPRHPGFFGRITLSSFGRMTSDTQVKSAYPHQPLGRREKRVGGKQVPYNNRSWKLCISFLLPFYQPLQLQGKFGNVVSEYVLLNSELRGPVGRKKGSQFSFCQYICSIKGQINCSQDKIFYLILIEKADHKFFMNFVICSKYQWTSLIWSLELVEKYLTTYF